MIKGKVLYSGVDWLTIGVFAEAEDKKHWENKIEELRKLIGTEMEDKPFRYEPLTSKKLAEQHYSIMLREFRYNIAIKVARTPKKSKIQLVKWGVIKMPDFLIEIPAKALRPQNIAYTENFIKSVFKMFKAKMYGFIYSRVDFNTDIYNTNEEFINNILKLFNARKEKRNYTEEYSETYKNKELWSIKKGVGGYKELSIYRSLNRDTELIQIYNQALNDVVDKEKLKLTWRFELRLSRKYLRLHKDYKISKIHFTQYLSLKRIIHNAFSVFEEDNNIKELKFLFKEQEHIQIKGFYKEHSTIDTKQAEVNTEEIYKIIIGLFKKSYEILEKEFEVLNAEDVFFHFFNSLKSMKDYIKEKAEETKDKFLINLSEAVNYIKDLGHSIFTNLKRINYELVNTDIEIKEDDYKEKKILDKSKKVCRCCTQDTKRKPPEIKTFFDILTDEIANIL